MFIKKQLIKSFYFLEKNSNASFGLFCISLMLTAFLVSLIMRLRSEVLKIPQASTMGYDISITLMLLIGALLPIAITIMIEHRKLKN